MPLLISDQ